LFAFMCVLRNLNYMSKQILQSYNKYCEEQSLRASKPREEVLRIIASAKKPQTAYEILDELGKVIKSPKPPTVYRALEALSEHGFIHRIESLNAYIACDENHRHDGSQFMICDDCGGVIETHLCELPQSLRDKALQSTFVPSCWNLEIHGTCEECA